MKTLMDFEMEYAGRLPVDTLSTETLYTSYQVLCRKRNQTPVDYATFYPTGARIIVCLRAYWCDMQRGICVNGEAP